MRRSLRIAALGAVVTLSAAAPAAAQSPELYWANRAVDELAGKWELNDYYSGDDDSKLTWAGINTGVTQNKTSCSPFVTRVIKQARGFTDARFEEWCGTPSPSSSPRRRDSAPRRTRDRGSVR